MRGARGTTLLGLGLVVVAGMFDAPPLYVPGIALVLLGAGSAAWVRGASKGLRVERTISAARVVEGDELLVEVDVRAGRIAPPAGEVDDPLLLRPSPLSAGRRHTRVRIKARFSRRGRRRLPAPHVTVRDPLGLAARTIAGVDSDEVLVLPRIEPVLAPHSGGEGATGGRGRPVAAAEVDLDALRPHRPGTPASRISWPAFARTGDLHERVMRADADTRPLVVLDLRGTRVERDVDAAVRAAGSLCVHLAERGGVALLLPGERRPLRLEPGLRGWPQAHARLAVVEAGEGPALAGLSGRRGAILWVAARPLNDVPSALLRAPGTARILVVPGVLPGRRGVFAVAGCTGYALGGTRAARRAVAEAEAG